jgi:hypothetical protein
MTQESWTELSPDLTTFFDDFDARSGRPDGQAADLFAKSFLAVDPTRALALTPQVLAGALPARRRMFDDAGVGALRRTGARQLPLDGQHVLVNAQWQADRKDAEPVELSSTFLLRREPEGWRVLVYLNHRDVEALLAG